MEAVKKLTYIDKLTGKVKSVEFETAANLDLDKWEEVHGTILFIQHG